MFSQLSRRLIKKGVLAVFLVSFLFLPFSAKADPDKMTDVQRSMLLNKPGVVFISHYDTTNIVIQTSAGYPQLAGKTYTVQSGSMGSGFVVNPEGYILTNGHVVKTPEKYLAYQSIMMAADAMAKDIVRAEIELSYGYSPSDQEIESLMPEILAQIGGKQQLILALFQAYEAGEVKVEKTQTEIYVQQGAFLSGKKLPIEKGMKADIRAVDFDGFTEEGEILGKDIAIIKVSGSNMPTVKLGDSGKTQVGDKIYVIGYPGVPTFMEFLSKESQLDSSTTSGIISALKTMKDGSQVLQTDASITHGNSGGPAFNEKGEVIGVASLGAVDKEGKELAGFNYLRPSNVAKEFLNEKSVENKQGKTDEHFKKGIEYYEKGRYSKAINEFETVIRLYPNHLEAQEYLKKSQEGLSSQPFTSKILDYLSNTTVIVIIVLVIVLGVGASVLIKVARKEKKMEEKVEELEEKK